MDYPVSFYIRGDFSGALYLLGPDAQLFAKAWRLMQPVFARDAVLVIK